MSKNGLFKLLEEIGCPQKLLNVISSFHEDMEDTVLFDGSSSFPTSINNGVKQGCVLAPILFGIFFSLLLSFAFSVSEDGVFLLTRSDGKLFNLSRLRAKTKVRQLLFREMLFADDAYICSNCNRDCHSRIGLYSHSRRCPNTVN